MIINTELENKIRTILLDNQRSASVGSFFPRALDVERIERKATIITGMRRVGKSIYQRMYMKSLLDKGVSKQQLCILDFSDDRLYELRNHEPDIISEVYYTLFPEMTEEKVFFFFDEIQYLYHWELFVNRLQTTRNCEVNITGSSAKLLVKEIASEFGGRSLSWELFPFSFSEYIQTKKEVRAMPSLRLLTGDDEKFCLKWFDEYSKIGGFPESIFMAEEITRVRFLQDIAETVVFRDVIKRYDLHNAKEVWRLMQLALNNMSDLTSYAKLKQRMAGEHYRVSQPAVKETIGYFNDAYLIYTVEKFSLNPAVRATNAKKFYCCDHALAMSVAEKLTSDKGKILENMVFMHLRRFTNRIDYAKTTSGKEIDFITASSGVILTDDTSFKLFQVCYELESTKTFERETEALWEAMEEFGVNNSTIITYKTESHIERDNRIINIVPAWKFLLQDPLSSDKTMDTMHA
jgi:predicted AAA+ superfamily ATPase